MSDVICPQCKGKFHETTNQYDPSIPANGSMFRLKEPWRSWRWSSFPGQPFCKGGDIVCPQCGAKYLDDKGRACVVSCDEKPKKGRRKKNDDI